MRQEFENSPKSVAEAEETLRQMALLSAPEGLTTRVHERLGQERIAMAEATQNPERKGFWRLWLPAHRLQFAGAALLAGVVVVSTLSVRHHDAKSPVVGVPVPVQSGAFGPAAAQGHPQSLTPIHVPAAQAKKKKPSAKHVAKSQAVPAEKATTQPAQ